jgi:abhydrolase domain-containing protein 12
LIHAEDDYDIPSYHTQQLFQHAVNATVPGGITLHEFESKKNESKTDLGAAGSVVEWETQNGVIREEILKYGSHDVIMDYPVITMAVMRIFTSVDPSFK